MFFYFLYYESNVAQSLVQKQDLFVKRLEKRLFLIVELVPVSQTFSASQASPPKSSD